MYKPPSKDVRLRFGASGLWTVPGDVVELLALGPLHVLDEGSVSVRGVSEMKHMPEAAPRWWRFGSVGSTPSDMEKQNEHTSDLGVLASLPSSTGQTHKYKPFLPLVHSMSQLIHMLYHHPSRLYQLINCATPLEED